MAGRFARLAFVANRKGRQFLVMPPASYICLTTLVCLSLLCGTLGLVGNCSQAEPIYVFQTEVGFQIHPMRLEAFPAYQGRRAAAIGVLWEPTVVMERNRTFNEIDGTPLSPPMCSYPVNILNDPFNDDPTVKCNTRQSIACGTIIQQIPFSEMDCTTSTSTDIFHGALRRTFAVFFTHPSYPDMRITLRAHLVNESFIVYPFNNPEEEGAIRWDYAYVFGFFDLLSPFNSTILTCNLPLSQS